MPSTDDLKHYHLEEYLFGDVSTRFRKDGSLTAEDFFCIVIWKAVRAKTFVAKRMLSKGHKTLDAAVAELAESIFSAADDKARFEVLFDGWGFNLPMATAILTVLYPETFTIYDRRVCETLDGFWNAATTSKSDRAWQRYCEFRNGVRNAVPDASVSLRDKDRILWARSFATQLANDISSNFGVDVG